MTDTRLNRIASALAVSVPRPPGLTVVMQTASRTAVHGLTASAPVVVIGRLGAPPPALALPKVAGGNARVIVRQTTGLRDKVLQFSGHGLLPMPWARSMARAMQRKTCVTS